VPELSKPPRCNDDAQAELARCITPQELDRVSAAWDRHRSCMLDIAQRQEACLATLAGAPSAAAVGDIPMCRAAGRHLSLMRLADELQRCQIKESLSTGKLLADFMTVRSAPRLVLVKIGPRRLSCGFSLRVHVCTHP